MTENASLTLFAPVAGSGYFLIVEALADSVGEMIEQSLVCDRLT